MTESSTTILRRMLDERGVEWTANDGEYVKETCWTYMCELTAAFAEYNDGTIRFACDTRCFTPEQAIDATLGVGTCHDAAGSQMAFFACSACGATTERKHPRFCFACGRKVVDDG